MTSLLWTTHPRHTPTTQNHLSYLQCVKKSNSSRDSCASSRKYINVYLFFDVPRCRKYRVNSINYCAGGFSLILLNGLTKKGSEGDKCTEDGIVFHHAKRFVLKIIIHYTLLEMTIHWRYESKWEVFRLTKDFRMSLRDTRTPFNMKDLYGLTNFPMVVKGMKVEQVLTVDDRK